MEKNSKHQDELLRTVMHKVAEDTERMRLSDDFADRLVQRIRQEEATKRNRMQHKRIWLSVGIAAAILLLLVMGFWLNNRFNEKSELMAQTDTTKTAPQIEEKKVEEQTQPPMEKKEKADTLNKVKEIQRVPRPPQTYMARVVEKEIVQQKKDERPDTIVFTEPPYIIFSPKVPTEDYLGERFMEREEAIAYDDYSIEPIHQHRSSTTYEDLERDIRIRGERMTQAIELAMSDDLY